MHNRETIRILVVDDERPARREMKRMLKALESIELVGEAADGLEAVGLIRELRPDVVLLDIQMPGLNGFQVIRRLGDPAELPSIIFVTAYDQYALEAFEVHAVDYLLKPVEEQRLARAIENVRRMRSGRTAAPDLGPLLETMGVIPHRVAIRRGDAYVMADAENILYATISAGEVHVVTREFEGATAARSLEELERELPPGLFVRVHRSYLANLKQIHEIRPWMSGGYRLTMGGTGGPVIPVSRARARELRNILKW
jgi:DNA-binding LytR/AlgR family response regulator